MDAETITRKWRDGELNAERLLDLLVEQARTIERQERTIETFRSELDGARRELSEAHREIKRLKERLGDTDGQQRTGHVDEEYSLKAEEKRRRGKRRRKQKSARRGRRPTEEKLARAERIEPVYPEGVPPEKCTLHRKRPVWRIEQGRAVLVAYHIYRGPSEVLPRMPGILKRCEYGLEILVTPAFQVYIVGLSMEKVCRELAFFWELELSKSQAETLLNRLAREWEPEFDALCELLAVSTVVHADETSWSINSVWALLSESVRLLLFGVPKDAATLETLLPKNLFAGVLVSDDAAVYRDFSLAQKCWAHLIRKAIKLTLLAPENTEYRRFLDGLLAVYHRACRFQQDKRLKRPGREKKVRELETELWGLCESRFCDESEPAEEAERDYRNLVGELMRLMRAEELFTFVLHPEVDGTNNEGERGLRDTAETRKTGRTNKSLRGARCRTVITSVFESLRRPLPEFTLRGVLEELHHWSASGVSRFRERLHAHGLALPERSPLDVLLPRPDG